MEDRQVKNFQIYDNLTVIAAMHMSIYDSYCEGSKLQVNWPCSRDYIKKQTYNYIRISLFGGL